MEEREILLRQAEVLAAERRPKACLGCGFEHRCSTHWCAVINAPVETVRKNAEKLAAYEATGLEPEEIQTGRGMCAFYRNRQCNLDGDWCPEGPGCPNEISCDEAKDLLKKSNKHQGKGDSNE